MTETRTKYIVDHKPAHNESDPVWLLLIQVQSGNLTIDAAARSIAVLQARDRLADLAGFVGDVPHQLGDDESLSPTGTLSPTPPTGGILATPETLELTRAREMFMAVADRLYHAIRADRVEPTWITNGILSKMETEYAFAYVRYKAWLEPDDVPHRLGDDELLPSEGCHNRRSV